MLHMSETGAYTQEMLEPFSDRLANLKEILKRDSADGKHPEPIVRLMSRKLEGVGEYHNRRGEELELRLERQFNDLQASLSVLSVELVPIHQKIVALRKQLSVMSAEPKFNKTEFRAIMEELRKVDQYVHSVKRAADSTDCVGNEWMGNSWVRVDLLFPRDRSCSLVYGTAHSRWHRISRVEMLRMMSRHPSSQSTTDYTR
jgi:hypothetical protein